MSAPAPSYPYPPAVFGEPGNGVYESNLINGDHPLLWKRLPPEAGSKLCCRCKTSKAASAYSNAQLKHAGKRLCAECVLAAQWKTPLPEPGADTPIGEHLIVIMSCADEMDRAPFLPTWTPHNLPLLTSEFPKEFTWLAPDAPASRTPPDAATLAARRAIVAPFFHSAPLQMGAPVLWHSSLPIRT